jgi:plasmid stabilization system protein ParE
MPFAIITTTNARKDIQQAIDWENTRSLNLGERFLEYLNQKLLALSFTPLIGSIRYENVRCTTTDVFQYLIHYLVDEQLQQIIVIRVLHTKQKPIW